MQENNNRAEKPFTLLWVEIQDYWRKYEVGGED